MIGRPSSGKSSLVNAVCGYKISIVSRQPQTTQSVIRGIYNDEDSQIIFLDTPGYHNFNAKLNKGLTTLAVNTLEEGDLILYIVDLTREFGQEEEEIINILNRSDKKIILAFNKSDIKTEISDKVINDVKSRVNHAAEIEVSALNKQNLDKLVKILKDNLPLGPKYYPEDYITDQSIPFRIMEVVREKVFNYTKNELPHSVYVDVFDLKVSDDLITSYANIFVERDSQRIILIGAKGSMIKKIGENARKDLIDIFDRDVRLFLKVKVHHKWKNDDKFLNKKYELG